MYLKKLNRKTRIERLEGRLVLAVDHVARMERLAQCFEEALRQIRSGDNWAAIDGDLPAWVGESNPKEIADKALEQGAKIVRGETANG